jgi:hypothetical protein
MTGFALQRGISAKEAEKQEDRPGIRVENRLVPGSIITWI